MHPSVVKHIHIQRMSSIRSPQRLPILTHHSPMPLPWPLALTLMVHLPVVLLLPIYRHIAHRHTLHRHSFEALRAEHHVGSKVTYLISKPPRHPRSRQKRKDVLF